MSGLGTLVLADMYYETLAKVVYYVTMGLLWILIALELLVSILCFFLISSIRLYFCRVINNLVCFSGECVISLDCKETIKYCEFCTMFIEKLKYIRLRFSVFFYVLLVIILCYIGLYIDIKRDFLFRAFDDSFTQIPEFASHFFVGIELFLCLIFVPVRIS